MAVSQNEEKRSTFLKLLEQVDFYSTSNSKYTEDLIAVEQKLLPHEKSSVLTSKIQELQQQDSDYTRLFHTFSETPSNQENKKKLIHFLKNNLNRLPHYQLLYAIQDVVQNKDWQILQILMVELKNRAYNKSLSLSNKKIDLQSVRDIFEDVEAKDISHLLPILDYLEPDKLISPRNIKTLSLISQKVQDSTPKDKERFARIMISAIKDSFITILEENHSTPKGESIQDPLSKENISKARKEMEKIFSKPGAEYLLEIYQKSHFPRQADSISSLWLYKKKNSINY